MTPLSIVVREDAMAPFDRWLATELSHTIGRALPRALVRKAIVSGVVAVGGRIVRDPGLLVKRGPSVFIRHFDWLKEREPERTLRILYEDDWVIAVDKPEGLPTHESKDPQRPSLTRMVEAHVGRRVSVHHRLDSGTSGVILFAKRAEANPALARAFAGREIVKSYVALVARPPVDWPKELEIDTPILVTANGEVRVDGKGAPAITRIRVIARRARHLLIEARPLTGRKHQIRAHLASVEAPIVGDRRYGGPPSPSGRIMLHAERIELAHPVTAEPLVISSPRPDEFREPAKAAIPPSAPRPPGTAQRSKRPEPGSKPGGAPRPQKRSRTGKGRRRPGNAGALGTRR